MEALRRQSKSFGWKEEREKIVEADGDLMVFYRAARGKRCGYVHVQVRDAYR